MNNNKKKKKYWNWYKSLNIGVNDCADNILKYKE
jgi:hypothetical protein